MKDSLNIVIAGATGYVGLELVKILSKHPKVKISYLCGNKSSGKTIYQYEFQPLFLNPQENVCKAFHNNLNTRNLERDNFVPKYPCVEDM